MEKEIIRELLRIEEQNEIKILYAVESGSRAWGFSSADSDWDVRYLYIHKMDWYLKIDVQKDSMEEILPNDIDLSGWELKKALRLFRKSNPPLLEWLRSPIVYKEDFSTATQLRQQSSQFFNARSCLHHYLHMAEGNYREYLQRDSVRLKKYFYVLRPILACDWIYHTNTMAPMEFERLVDSQVTDKDVKVEIDRLIERKRTGDELKEGPKIRLLNDFLDARIDHYSKIVQTVDKPEQPATHLLDDLFKRTITEVWQ